MVCCPKTDIAGKEYALSTGMPMAKLHILTTKDEAFQAAARFEADLAPRCEATQGWFTIVQSGGSTPRRLYCLLA